MLDQGRLGRVKFVPASRKLRQAFDDPGIGSLVDAVARAASPEASTLEGGLGRRLPRNATRLQVSVQVAIPLLMANDDRLNATPNVGVEFVKRSQGIFGTQPKFPIHPHR